MSVRASTWAWDAKCPTPAAKLVLLKLADHANEEGECWPSQSRIAADCGIPRETVNRVMKALVEASLIRVEHRTNGTGKLANRYFLLCDVKSHPDVISDHTPCDVRSHKPSIEPSRKEETTAIAVAKKPAAARGTRWPSGEGTYPEGKTVPLEWLKEGREWRPDLDMSNQSYLFEDYWVAKPGPNALKLDWRATWRNWVRNAKPDRPVNGHAYGGGLH
jgi:DNA-binding IscR family transcriptional regulator